MRLIAFLAAALALAAQPPVEKWGLFEVSLAGPDSGNPFTGVRLRADFRYQHRVVTVDGFYDGAGTYRIRFMPDMEGEWTYVTHSDTPALEGKTGRFVCIKPSAGNHGPVVVARTAHFSYSDGTAYYPVGTTCYNWVHQTDELEQQTLASLKSSPFNKLRMLILPTARLEASNETKHRPFVRRPDGSEDYTRFEPAFFHHLEERIRELEDAGVEADLILFHPYGDKHYSRMPAESDDRYLRYTVARLAAFRNVWWSAANEYDFLKEKTMADWDRFLRIIQESDPYRHLRSIHNSGPMYDHAKPWVTHVSVQSYDMEKGRQWVGEYRKPVIFDECQYEGTIAARWGNLSGQEMVRRFWLGLVYGAYAGHSETCRAPSGSIWLSGGGVLVGESPARIAFLRKLLEEDAAGGLAPLPNPYYPGAAREGEYYLYYFDFHQPVEASFTLPQTARFKADLIDPWQMTITPLAGEFSGRCKVPLPGKPYLALRFRKLN